ncbi:response regulator transcription factor [Limibacter armeniacum]|uniref:response regulator transcription factor n=1 Tax=Limibacter armeniacum TaxID=466084 RepID=UPI002FE6989D
MEKTRIMLVDDHKVIRDGIRSYFDDDPNYVVVIEAGSGEEALRLLKQVQVDIVIIDINMEEMDGITCTKQIVDNYEHINVIALTMLNEPQVIKQMMDAGAHAFLLKDCGKKELISALDTVRNGDIYYSNTATHTIMSSIGKKRASQTNTSKDIPLTPREKEVLMLITNEFSNKEIADTLFISMRTVDAHKRNLLEKTGSKNIAGLVKYALSLGIHENT